MEPVNHQLRLAARPTGMPTGSHWELTTEPVPAPDEGEFVVRISHLSIDPAMRGWMNDAPSYIAPVEIGAVMRAGAVGQITASRRPDFEAGEHVYGAFGVQEFARSNGDGVFKVDPSLAPLPTYLGALGMTGHDRVLRAAGCRPTRRRRDRGRLRCRRRSRQRRGTDRQAQGLPP